METSARDRLQRQGGLESDSGQLLASAVCKGNLRLVAGEMVFEETLPLLAKNEKFTVQRLQLVGQLADLSRTVRLPPEIMREAVAAILSGSAPPSPFTDRFADMDGLIQALLKGRHRIRELQSANLELDRSSIELMEEGRAIVQAELRKNRPRKSMTFENFLKLHPDPYGSLVGRYDLRAAASPLPKRLSDRLRSSRPLRMFSEGLCSLLYGRMILNRKSRVSDRSKQLIEEKRPSDMERNPDERGCEPQPN